MICYAVSESIAKQTAASTVILERWISALTILYNPFAKHVRSIKRALRRVRLRKINPAVAVRLIARNCYRIVRASVVLLTLLVVAIIVLLIVTSGSTIRKLRETLSERATG